MKNPISGDCVIYLSVLYEGFSKSGLITVDFSIEGPSENLKSAKLEISGIDGRGQLASIFIALSSLAKKNGSWVGQFSINTHKFHNGENEFSLRLVHNHDQTLAVQSLTLNIVNEGPLADSVRESLFRNNTPSFIFGPADSSQYDFADKSLMPWFDQPNALEKIKDWISAGDISKQESEYLQKFVVDGFLIMPNLIEDTLLNRINKEIDQAIARKWQGYEYGSSQRIQHLHIEYPGVRELWLHPKVMRMLRLIFQARPRPCQTLTFVFGSQQDAHQDTIHLTPFPAGYMCGVWVALEDVQPNSGELEVYIGSHKLPRLYMKDFDCQKIDGVHFDEFREKVVNKLQKIVTEGKFQKLTYRPKAGTVLIWHENLMHAGSIRKDKNISRRSIVSHVFADGVIAFYDSTGMAGYMAPLETISS